MTNIHPSAVVHPKVKIKRGVRIGPYAIVNSPDIELGEGVEIKPHVHIDGKVSIKKDTVIYPFASIGTPPQNLSYQGEVTAIEIGERCQIREYVSINSSCGIDEKLTIGDDCFIMAYCHIAHNCKLGNGIVMANGATLGGHVIVGDYANFGGLCAIHQKVKIGEHAMIGGGSMVSVDVPPYCLGIGYPFQMSGLNWIGLKRKGVSHEDRKKIIKAYRITLLSGLAWESARDEIIKTIDMTPYVQRWIEFCDQSLRGLSPARTRGSKKKDGPQNRDYPELVEMG